MLEDDVAATLGQGKEHVAETLWDGSGIADGWLVRTVRAPILDTSKVSTAEYSVARWGQELGLTRYANQELPVIFGGNSLELYHQASGVRISFCALEALRSWALLDHPPVPYRSKTYPPCEWDYSFTTPYPGSTVVAPPGKGAVARCNLSSFVYRPAVNLANGKAVLRPPLCKCKTVRGLVPDASPPAQELEPIWRPDGNPPPPAWQASKDKVAIESLLASQPDSLFEDSIDLWVDNLDPQSFSSLSVKVIVTPEFWAAYLRCFLRVNGVMARVIDTRFVCHASSQGRKVVRERSWREGDWATYAGGPDAPDHIDFGGRDAAIAAQRLPHSKPPVTEELLLPLHLSPERPVGSAVVLTGLSQRPELNRRSGAVASGVFPRGPNQGRQAVELDGVRLLLRPHNLAAASASGSSGAVGKALSPRWRRDCPGLAWLGGGGGILVLAVEEGAAIEAVEARYGERLWSKPMPDGGGALVSAAVSPVSGLLATGSECGEAQVWEIGTGVTVARFAVGPELHTLESRGGSKQRQSSNRWVEQVAWDAAGTQLGAAAGRDTVLVDAASGELRGRGQASGAVYALRFSALGLAVGSYGGVSWVAQEDKPPAPRLEIGAAAVLSLAVSPDGQRLAAGCLDQRVRVFALGAEGLPPGDWSGFDGPVRHVAWSAEGKWLAACGGSGLLVVQQDLPKGEAPTVCLPPTQSEDCRTRGFAAIAWSPGTGPRERILAGVSALTGECALYDVTLADQAVPRRALPIATVSCPGTGPMARLQLCFIAEGGGIEGCAAGAEPIVVLGWGDQVAAAAAPPVGP